MKIITREEAKKLNQKWYYTGEPCKYGHIDKRYVNTDICYTCKRNQNKKQNNEKGNIIVYWSARGQNTGINWTELTAQQLTDWGCKYHDVIMRQKPAYDLLIDDKSKRIEEI